MAEIRRRKVPHRDRLLAIKAPFKGAPSEDLQDRAALHPAIESARIPGWLRTTIAIEVLPHARNRSSKPSADA